MCIYNTPGLVTLALPAHVDTSKLEMLSINTNDLTGITSAELGDLGNLRQLKAGCNRIGLRGLPDDFARVPTGFYPYCLETWREDIGAELFAGFCSMPANA